MHTNRPSSVKNTHSSPVTNSRERPSTSTTNNRPASKDIFSLDYKEKQREQSKVCFLSGRERTILSGGHSRLDCEFHRERRDVGPGSYKTEKNTSALQTLDKVTSTVGYGGIASRAARFSEHRRDSYSIFVPTPFHKKCLIHVPKLRVGKAAPPFGSAVPRKTGVGGHKEDTPGFYYDITMKKREMPFDHTFGGRTHLRPHVQVKCTPENLDVCCRCEAKPVGDYWYSGADYLCRSCFSLEWNNPSKFTRKQLDAFKKIRDCSNIHQHEGTTAAYPLMKDRDIWRQKILECYFACFEGPRKIVNTEPRGQTRQSRCQNGKIGRSKSKGNIQVLFKNTKNKSFVNL